jgi:hypothetical protein
MVRTFLKVYVELGSYFLFLQEQIKISSSSHANASPSLSLPNPHPSSLLPTDHIVEGVFAATDARCPKDKDGDPDALPS